MTKAILELSKMPKSCWECPFYKITDICDILSTWNNYMPVLVPSEGKRDDCPIRPINEIKKSIINEVSQFLQDNNFEEASKAIDAEYEL